MECPWRVTPDVIDDCIIHEPPSTEGPDVTYTVCADKQYSFLVFIDDGVGGVAPQQISFSVL